MKIAVITGASTGMGREFLLALDREYQYDEIWAIARSADKLEALGGLTRAKVRPVPLDLTLEDSFLTVDKLLRAENPVIDLLLNCSGYGKFGGVESVPLEDDLGMIDLNVKALVRMTRLCLPYMTKGSVILNLDSLSAFQSVPYLNTYAATKAFVLSYSRGLYAELRPRGIHVMAICPGWVQTPFFDRAKTKDVDAVTYYNIVFTPEQIVKTGLKDLKKRKKVSIHDFRIRLQVLGVKLLPEPLVTYIWLKQQKKI
ncbi:MAG: SDR family NAD(P)-dependent oxidoreductase [Clostridia bacterium]|nr:SDR family NAD(P)-dependent oxidoreductase [Clostridia bacterium]